MRVKGIPGGVKRHASDLKDNVNNKLDDQNFMQTVYTTAGMLFELYRATTSSLLIVFVYQECGGKDCVYDMNLQLYSTMYLIMWKNSSSYTRFLVLKYVD